jgi:hypothetical protein
VLFLIDEASLVTRVILLVFVFIIVAEVEELVEMLIVHRLVVARVCGRLKELPVLLRNRARKHG